EVATAYQAFGTPAAVLIHPDGTLASLVAGGADAIAALVDDALSMTDPGAARAVVHVSGHAPGSLRAVAPSARRAHRLPRLRLPHLQGHPVELADLVDRPTCLLFWNPRCSFCIRILDEIRAWERDPPPGAPGLLVISSGGAEEMRRSGF